MSINCKHPKWRFQPALAILMMKLTIVGQMTDEILHERKLLAEDLWLVLHAVSPSVPV